MVADRRCPLELLGPPLPARPSALFLGRAGELSDPKPLIEEERWRPRLIT